MGTHVIACGVIYAMPGWVVTDMRKGKGLWIQTLNKAATILLYLHSIIQIMVLRYYYKSGTTIMIFGRISPKKHGKAIILN